MGIINRIGGSGINLAALRAAMKTLGPTLLLDADLIAGSDGAAIGTWADDSGNGHDFSQATAGKKPLLKKAANGINGHNVLRFDGSDDDMESAAYANTMITTTADTIWAVFKIFAIDTDVSNLYSNDTIIGTYGRGLVFRTSNGLNSYGNDGGAYRTVAKTVSTSVPYITRSRHSPGTIYHQLNGDAERSASLSTLSNISYTMRLATISNVNFAQIDIAEIIIFNSALSAGNMAIVDAYLRAKYATY